MAIQNVSIIQISNLLSSSNGSNNGIINCLSGCSGHGTCALLSSGYGCSCDFYYTGAACETDMRACSTVSCLNGGTCLDNLIDYSFTCDCMDAYYGTYCENQEDLCANVTCSNQGYCTMTNGTVVCKCFKNYYGDDCELETSELKAIKSTIDFLTILTFFILGSFVCLVLFMDFTNFFCTKNKSISQRDENEINKNNGYSKKRLFKNENNLNKQNAKKKKARSNKAKEDNLDELFKFRRIKASLISKKLVF